MSLARSNLNAMMRIGDNQIACRVEGGFIVAAQKKVRLFFGPHLYAAVVGTPGPTQKVTPYQPGYMALAAAMGATLVVPPTVPDPATGRPVANPQIELVPGSSVIRSVKATAICVARDAMGVYHVSNQSITVDSESVLRQALLKIESDELVQVLSDAEVQADREAGKLRGWITVPFMPGYQLAGRAGAKAIREALQTYNNLSATIRQRACTKAERLACDHNPVLRMSWVYGDLKIDVEGKNGIRQSTVIEGCRDGEKQITVPYAEVDVVSWTESRGQAAIDAFVQALLASQEVDGVGSMTINAAEGLEDGTDEDEDEAEQPRQITQKVDAPALVIPTRQPEPVAVQAPAPEPAPVAAHRLPPMIEKPLKQDHNPRIREFPAPAPVQAPAPAPAAPINGHAVLRLQGKCKGMEAQLPPADVTWARNKAGVAVDADLDEIRDGAALERLMATLKEAVGGAQ